MVGRALKCLVLSGALLACPASGHAQEQEEAAPAPSAPSEAPAPPATQPQRELHWDPAWTHANVWDYSLTAVGVTSLVLEGAILQPIPATAHWYGPILFDSAVRDVTRGNSAETRNDADTISWVLWFAEVGYPFVVDVPYAWARFNRTVAWDLFWQSAVTMSLSGAFDIALRDFVGRVRPGNYECLQAGGKDCMAGNEAARSFPSGHITETSTATALICTQHLKMQLYGAPGDAITCASAITADVAVGALRLVADNHWFTDLVASGAIGFAFGWGVPTLMHMHGHAVPAESTAEWKPIVLPMPMVIGSGGGVGAVGIF